MFVVMCKVSGGFTGTRQAELKKGGRVQYFDTREAAQREADHLSAQMNGPHATAKFQYWPEEAN